METSLKVFDYGKKQVRTVEKDGEAWFVAKDVAEALAYTNPQKAIRDHVESEDRRGERIVTPSGTQTATVINEAGVYSLIFSSKLPSAKQFKHWVTHEVLPDIRKHGMYMSDKLRNVARVDPEAFNSVVDKYLNEKEKVRKLEAKIEADKTFTDIGHLVLSLKGSITVTDVAQLCAEHGYDIGRNRLYKFYRDLGLISKQKNRKNKPTQKGIEKGLVNLQIGADGNLTLTTRTMVTPEGLNQTLKLIQAIQRPLEALWEVEEN